MSTCHSSLITLWQKVPSLNSIHVLLITPIENQNILSKAQQRFLSLSPGSEESYWRFNYSPQEQRDEAECVMSAALKPCVSRAGEPVHLVSIFSTYPCQSILHWWNLYIPVRYSVTLRNVLLRSTKNSLKINRKCCFILERLYESCTDGHGLLGHVWSADYEFLSQWKRLYCWVWHGVIISQSSKG